MSYTQPREIAELKGAHKKHPERYRKAVPKKDSPIGNAPDHLRDEAKAIWFEVCSFSIPGVLTEADRHDLEILSNLFADYRDDPSGFPAVKIGHMLKILGMFGMSPADRNKLAIDAPKEKNPFAELDS